jgi:hypothetical protein
MLIWRTRSWRHTRGEMLATQLHAALAPRRGKSLTRLSHCLDFEQQNRPACRDLCARLVGYEASLRRELLSRNGTGSPRVATGEEACPAEASRLDTDGAVSPEGGDGD